LSILLEKPIRVNRILSLQTREAKAIEAPIRSAILQILYRRKLAIENICAELRKEGYDKAETTVRHHLLLLKNAGLVEIVKIKEVRGAVMKFYSTSTKLLNFKIPTNFDSDFERIIIITTTRMQKMMNSITEKSLAKVKKKNKEKNLEPGYVDFILMEIMNRALTNVLENNHSSSYNKN